MGSRVSPVILISDDSVEMMLLYRMTLEHKGGFQHVIYVPSAEDVIRTCQDQPVALVISDIAKPHVDGFELLRRLRADPATCHIPFMFVTSHSDNFSQRTAFELGADAFMTLPFSPGVLLDNIHNLLGNTGSAGRQRPGGTAGFETN